MSHPSPNPENTEPDLTLYHSGETSIIPFLDGPTSVSLDLTPNESLPGASYNLPHSSPPPSYPSSSQPLKPPHASYAQYPEELAPTEESQIALQDNNNYSAVSSGDYNAPIVLYASQTPSPGSRTEEIQPIKTPEYPDAHNSNNTRDSTLQHTVSNGEKSAYGKKVYRDAIAYLKEEQLNALRSVEEYSGTSLETAGEDCYSRLRDALQGTNIQKKQKVETVVEKSISYFIIHRCEYEYYPYSPDVAEEHINEAHRANAGTTLKEKWDNNRKEWAETHKKARGKLIEIRKKHFRNIISDGQYKKLNNMKNSHLSSFRKRLEEEALQQHVDWAMTKHNPNYNK